MMSEPSQKLFRVVWYVKNPARRDKPACEIERLVLASSRERAVLALLIDLAATLPVNCKWHFSIEELPGGCVLEAESVLGEETVTDAEG
jgi:hypothetical protein